MNKIIEGNILGIGYGVIGHQVNCHGVAGAGLAKQIRQLYPGWYANYRNNNHVLGSTTFYWPDEKRDFYIANIYGQYDFGHGRRFTDYGAFRDALTIIPRFSDLPVYLPFGIGCGLAGGDWNVIRKIIHEELPKAIIIKLPEY